MTRKATVEQAVLAELLDELRIMRATHTELWAQISAGSITNDVLHSGSHTLDANGLWTDAFHTPYGSMLVVNLSQNDMTVISAAPSGVSPPATGTGVHRVPAGMAEVMNLAGTSYAVYGTAGSLLNVQVFTKAQPPWMGAASQIATGTLADADGQANASAALLADGHQYLYNGATWDRAISVQAANAGTATLGRASAQSGLKPSTRLNAVTATGASTGLDLVVCHRVFTMQTIVTGGPTTTVVNLEGSLDNANWYVLATSNSTTGDGQFASDKTARFVRCNLTTLTGGASPAVTAIVGIAA